MNLCPPETDLWIPRPAAGETWHPETIHTHFFGCPVPESSMSVFTYIRYLPALGICQGGVLIYQGLDNVVLQDFAFCDYRLAMPWPTVEGSAISTVHGLRYDFVEPGRETHITFRSTDGTTSIDLVATAVTPLAARGHVLPDELENAEEAPGGSEQFLRFEGEVVVDGTRHPVSSYGVRDRSWRQVRSEAREASKYPPLTWTPICFGEDLSFNVMGFEAPDTEPLWRGAFDLPEGAPTFAFAWASRDGELRGVRRVHRRDVERHPLYLHPLKMQLEVEDDHGEISRVTGEAIAFGPLPQWYNVATFESIMRWQDDQGRVTYGQAQSIWNYQAQQAMRGARVSPLAGAGLGAA